MTCCHSSNCRCHVFCKILAWLRRLEKKVNAITNGSGGDGTQPKDLGVLHMQQPAQSGASGRSTLDNNHVRRSLPAEEVNTIDGATVVDGYASLPAGTYEVINCWAVGVQSGRHRVRLASADGSTTYLLGTIAFAEPSYTWVTSAMLAGQFTLTETSDVALWHYTQYGYANGQGVPDGDSYDEVFAELYIRKIA